VLEVSVACLIASSMSALLPSPGGFGSLDIALVAALVPVGAPATAALATVLAYRLLTVWLALLPGLRAGRSPAPQGDLSPNQEHETGNSASTRRIREPRSGVRGARRRRTRRSRAEARWSSRGRAATAGAPPQLADVRVPHDLPVMVVAVQAQRQPEHVLVLVVLPRAPQVRPVRARSRLPPRPARQHPASASGPPCVDQPERPRCQGHEDRRMAGHFGRDTLPASQASRDELPRVLPVPLRAGRTHRRPPIPARLVDHAGGRVRRIRPRAPALRFRGRRAASTVGAVPAARSRQRIASQLAIARTGPAGHCR
jgi:hypothetical protein